MRSFVLRVYAALLFAYPSDLRRTHGNAMRQCAADALRVRGMAAVPRLFLDLLVSVPREWTLVMKGIRVGSWINGLGKDVVYAVRLLARSAGFTTAAVVTLALGIGANAAIFSLADATLLRPLKVATPAALYSVKFSSAYPDYEVYRSRSDLFDGVIATAGGRVNIVADGRAELAGTGFVSGNYFGVLGVPPAAGRVLVPADDDRNGPIHVVLSYVLWHTRFGGDPAAIGKTIRVNDMPATIVGVAAKGFHGLSLAETARVFIPVTQTPRVQTGFFARPAMLTTRDMVWLNVIVRLKEGISPQAGGAALEAMYRQFHPPRPGVRAEPLELVPLELRATGGTNQANVVRFVALLGAVVALTLLIGCANIANLLLSRAAARRREIGVRMAVGASRLRIARQLFVESLVLSVAGAAAGLYVASAALGLLGRFQLPGGIEIAGLALDLNGPAIAFTAAIACVTAVVFGLAPAWRAARLDMLDTLHDGGRATSAPSGLRSTLVAVQVALSVVLLAGTGLFLRSLVESLRVPLGFQVRGVATASVNLGAARYDRVRADAFYEEALNRVHRIPGVQAAAWASLVPIAGSRVWSTGVEGYQPRPGEEMLFNFASVGPEYFAAAGTRLLRGRAFTNADGARAPAVGIINEAAAKKYWAGRDPLQSRIGEGKTWIQIIGVAETAKVETLDEEPAPFVYLPFAQDDMARTPGVAHLFVRTTGDESALLAPLGEQLRAIDRNAPVYNVSTFAWRVRELIMPQQMGVTLFAVFSALAITLAAIGIYGVASYVTMLRTRELGIRIALGADRMRIRRLVLWQGSMPVAAGLLAGLLIAAIASQAAAAFLRGVSPTDPLTYAAVFAFLATVALAATWIPARRAAHLDPIRALRHN